MARTPNDAVSRAAIIATRARDAVIALFRRYAPNNFGIDLEPPQAPTSQHPGQLTIDRRTDGMKHAPRRGARRRGPASRAVIALFRRYVPENFGVDLEPPAPGRPQPTLRSLLTVTKAKAFVHALLLTRLDRSGGRIRTLALGVFAAYAALGVKLVVLGVSHDPPQTLREAADQAVSGARPDLLDRNGELLATDVKTMSVFAEPNRIIDKDEAVELITAVLPDVDAKELRERLGSKKGFVWVKRQITPKEQAGDLPSRPARRRVPAREQARLSQRAGRRARARVRRQGQCRHRRHGEISRRAEPDGSARARLRRRPGKPEAGAAVDRPQGRRTRCATSSRPAWSAAGQGRGRRGHRRQHRRGDRARIAARLRPERAARRARPDQDQPDQRRRLRDGLDLQGAVDRDGARFRARSISARASTRATPCATAASPSTTSTPPIAC